MERDEERREKRQRAWDLGEERYDEPDPDPARVLNFRGSDFEKPRHTASDGDCSCGTGVEASTARSCEILRDVLMWHWSSIGFLVVFVGKWTKVRNLKIMSRVSSWRRNLCDSLSDLFRSRCRSQFSHHLQCDSML